MNFRLTEEQKMVKDMVHEFAEKEIKPNARKYDESGEFPWDNIRKMAQLGLMGMLIPREYGGAGTDTISYVIALEEISRACASTGITMAAHNSLGTMHIYMAGTEEQRQKYVPKLAKGEYIGAWGLTEPEAGSDAGSLKTKATLKNGEWILNGTKLFITNAHEADVITVMAVTDPDKGIKGISAFIVEKNTPGLVMGRKEDKMGLRASVTSQFFLEDCRVPKENLLGERGNGFISAMKILDAGRIGIGAMAVGIAQAAYEEALNYAKTREQFGKKISQFQIIQNKLVNMATRIEAARLLVYRAAFLRDNGEKHKKEASMAKLYASETATWVTTEAIQIFGGYGYIKEYSVERFFRDAKLCEIGEGTSEVQRLVIARELGLE